jgi:hypothetical protein
MLSHGVYLSFPFRSMGSTYRRDAVTIYLASKSPGVALCEAAFVQERMRLESLSQQGPIPIVLETVSDRLTLWDAILASELFGVAERGGVGTFYCVRNCLSGARPSEVGGEKRH